MTRPQRVTVHTPQGPKVVGTYAAGVLRKRVKRSKHFFWKLRAWGMDAAALAALAARGCTQVEYLDTESSTVYSSDMADWQDKGHRGDYGHGRQVFLPLVYWTSKRADANQPELFKGA